MLKQLSRILMVTIFGLVVSACANSDFSHNYIMRGQVVSATSDNIYVCVGLEDGAEVGQILDAYRFVMNDDNDEGAALFIKQDIGKVKIDEIVDEHFAKVTVLEGNVKQYDMVELNK